MDLKTKRTLEIILVVLGGIIDTFIILWKTILTPGLIYVRDSYPPIIQPKPSFVSNGMINLITLMDNPDMPLLLFQYFFPSCVNDKLSYIYPIFLGFISMYFSSKYFLKVKYREVIAGIIAFLYTISPAFMYFTYWNDYATFVALYPALLAGLDYVSKSPGVKSALLLAMLASLTTTDPRGFSFTVLTVLAYALYSSIRRDLKFLKTFAIAIPVYIALNIRTFIALFLQQRVYTGLGNSIEVVQLWLNYYTFSFEDNLRGIGIFRPLINLFPNPLFYVYSFFLPLFTILGFVFFVEKLRKTSIPFYLALYILIVVVESSTIDLFNHQFTLNLVYYINDWLKNTPFFTYMWIFLPTYVTEMIPALLFLTFAGVVNEVLSVRIRLAVAKLLPIFLLILVILGQVVYSYSSYSSGNYEGNYTPIPVIKPVYEIAEYLNTHATGKVAVFAGGPIYYQGKYYSPEILAGLPNATFINFYNSPYLSEILSFYGIQYVVTNEYYNLSDYPGIKLVMNLSGIAVYQNLNFKAEYEAKGIYILASYPQIYYIPPNSAVVPPYVYVPPKYLAGVINGSDVYVKADLFYNYSLKIPAQREPFSQNFSCTIVTTSHAQQILNTFPGIHLIQSRAPAKEYVNVGYGYFAIILTYVQYPEGGIIGVSNGTKTLQVATAGPLMVVSKFLGYFKLEGKLELIHPDYDTIYIVNLEAIPANLYNDSVNLSPENVNVTIYPVIGEVIPSIGYNIVIGKVEPPKQIDLTPALVLNLTFFITVLTIYFIKRKSK